MIWIYRIVFLPSLFVVLPFYLLRMLRRGGYGEDFMHRFGRVGGIPPRKSGVQRIWIQAVSVGEVFAIGPIVRSLNADPFTEVFLTTTTSTGYALAKKRYDSVTVGIAYFPLDFWLFSGSAWKRIDPDLCLLMESELWPEHIHQATRRRVPLLLVNGRMSDRTFRRLSRISFFAQGLLNRYEKILAASSEDEERFLSLGVDRKIVRRTGNIKLDVPLEPLLEEGDKHSLCTELGLSVSGEDAEIPLLILGSSTWPGEEEILLHLLEASRKAGINCRLLLVPRHAERRAEIRRILEASPFSFHFRSEGAAQKEVDVAVGDTTGELIQFTQLADLVFIGKSLPPNSGGQTPIEAAAFGKAILFGPYMTNFRALARDLVDSNAAVVVGDEVDLIEQALPLLKDSRERAKWAEAALRWHRANRGAVAKTLETIGEATRPE